MSNFQIGDRVIYNGHGGEIVEENSALFLILFDKRTGWTHNCFGKYPEALYYWVTPASLKLIKKESSTNRVCKKIKEMEERRLALGYRW